MAANLSTSSFHHLPRCKNRASFQSSTTQSACLWTLGLACLCPRCCSPPPMSASMGWLPFWLRFLAGKSLSRAGFPDYPLAEPALSLAVTPTCNCTFLHSWFIVCFPTRLQKVRSSARQQYEALNEYLLNELRERKKRSTVSELLAGVGKWGLQLKFAQDLNCS